MMPCTPTGLDAMVLLLGDENAKAAGIRKSDVVPAAEVGVTV